MSERLCRFCRRPLVPTAKATLSLAEEHCASRSCHWCIDCDRKKRSEAK